jgi:hypothetical protein
LPGAIGNRLIVAARFREHSAKSESKCHPIAGGGIIGMKYCFANLGILPRQTSKKLE